MSDQLLEALGLKPKPAHLLPGQTPRPTPVIRSYYQYGAGLAPSRYHRPLFPPQKQLGFMDRLRQWKDGTLPEEGFVDRSELSWAYDPDATGVDGLTREEADEKQPLFVNRRTLREAVAPYYDSAGGIEVAIEAAQRAMARRNASDSRFNKWDAEAVDYEVPVITQKNAEVLQKFAGNTEGLQYPRTGHILMAEKSSHPKAVLDHELTHAVTAGKSPDMTPIISHELAKRYFPPEGRMSEKHWNYFTTPAELDPRLAEIKRLYARDKGVLVNDMQRAEDAWEYFRQYGERPREPRREVLNGRPVPVEDEEFERTLHDSDFLHLDSLPGDTKRQLLQRMLELVRRDGKESLVFG